MELSELFGSNGQVSLTQTLNIAVQLGQAAQDGHYKTIDVHQSSSTTLHNLSFLRFCNHCFNLGILGAARRPGHMQLTRSTALFERNSPLHVRKPASFSSKYLPDLDLVRQYLLFTLSETKTFPLKPFSISRSQSVHLLVWVDISLLSIQKTSTPYAREMTFYTKQWAKSITALSQTNAVRDS